jgi:hypothetical protein
VGWKDWLCLAVTTGALIIADLTFPGWGPIILCAAALIFVAGLAVGLETERRRSLATPQTAAKRSDPSLDLDVLAPQAVHQEQGLLAVPLGRSVH